MIQLIKSYLSLLSITTFDHTFSNTFEQINTRLLLTTSTTAITTSNMDAVTTLTTSTTADGTPITFNLTRDDVLDFCNSYRFSVDESDGVSSVLKLYLCDLRKKIMDSSEPQSRCFVSVTTDLLRTLGYPHPKQRMRVIHGYYERAKNIYKDNLIPFDNISDTTYECHYNEDLDVNVILPQMGGLTPAGQTMRDRIAGRVPIRGDDGTPLGQVIPSALTASADPFDDDLTTLIRCGYIHQSIIPLSTHEDEDITLPIGVVLDMDVTKPKPETCTDEDLGRHIQMIECLSMCDCQLLVRYLKTLPGVIDAAIHDGVMVSALTVGHGQLKSLDELLGGDMSHMWNIRRVDDGYYDGYPLTLIQHPSKFKDMNFWPMRTESIGSFSKRNFLSRVGEKVKLDAVFNNIFNTPVKTNIILWLACIWDKMQARKYTPEDLMSKVFVLLTHDNIQDIFDIMWKDGKHIRDRLSVLDPTDEMSALISHKMDVGRLYNKTKFTLTDGRGRECTGDILNPLTYLPEGEFGYLFTVQNLYKLLRNHICSVERVFPMYRLEFKDHPIQFSTFVHALTDVDRITGPSCDDLLQTIRMDQEQALGIDLKKDQLYKEYVRQCEGVTCLHHQ